MLASSYGGCYLECAWVWGFFFICSWSLCMFFKTMCCAYYLPFLPFASVVWCKFGFKPALSLASILMEHWINNFKVGFVMGCRPACHAEYPGSYKVCLCSILMPDFVQVPLCSLKAFHGISKLPYKGRCASKNRVSHTISVLRFYLSNYLLTFSYNFMKNQGKSPKLK